MLRLAHTHSLVDEGQEHDYWAEPHASVNPDFTQIVFTSNWGRSGTGEVEMFLGDLPPDWPERLPAYAFQGMLRAPHGFRKLPGPELEGSFRPAVVYNCFAMPF